MKERIIELKTEIELLERKKKQIQVEINRKTETMKSLLILTENQLDLFKDENDDFRQTM